jgi:hypothetical protein
MKDCPEATGTCLGKMEFRIAFSQEPRKFESKTGVGGAKAMDFEANPEEIEATVETARALEDCKI